MHREALMLETDGFQILENAGIRCPRRLFTTSAADAVALDCRALGCDHVVIKVVAAHIAHKSEAGGVAVVSNDPASIGVALRRMERAFAGQPVAGYCVYEFISYDDAPGGEWLLGLRWTDEFGPVVTVGPGGVSTEFLAAALVPGRDVAVFLPHHSTVAEIKERLLRLAWTPLLIGGVRKQPARATLDQLCGAIEKFERLAEVCRPDGITDLEINPLVPSQGSLVALDVLVKLGSRTVQPPPPRPVKKLRSLLTPASIAVMGVSERMNPGHIILNNLIREGFDRSSVYVIKPNASSIEGCQTVPTIAALPQPVDLLILAVAAAQVPQALIDVVTDQKAESVIVIPGGLEEKAGTETMVAAMHDTLRESRRTTWQGPVVNGGNCLGIRSIPGHYNTLFIPAHKLPAPARAASPVALISASGAFAVAMQSRLAGLDPRYVITVGNQMDLTVGDYLTFLKDDPAIEVFAVYLEGFRPGDGGRVLAAIEAITAGGRTVILYRAGRTPAGAGAAASHTAAIAGDARVTRLLAEAAGALVAESLEAFEDLIRLFAMLPRRAVGGLGLGALSNAGYECVAMADALGPFELAAWTPATADRLAHILERARLSDIVPVRNPIDVTPMLGDEGYAAAVRAVLEDPHVDAAVVGCVPLTPALATLPAGPGHAEDVRGAGGVVARLVQIHHDIAKPWVTVVDAGRSYDPMALALEEGGIPTFRSADRALRAFARYCLRWRRA
jgi:acyl-CoA synthetase (NDP forming)